MSRWVCLLTRVGSIRDGYSTFPIADPTMVKRWLANRGRENRDGDQPEVLRR